MVKRRAVLSPERDLPLLTFLWRWKVATTKALHARFFPECVQFRAYARLLQLSDAGYLTAIQLGHQKGVVWSLTRKGFLVVREQLPALAAEGFASEHMRHDLLCAAFHLGDWLCAQPVNVSLFSEQQLRTYDPEMYPAWVPASGGHRADGYSFVQGQSGDRVIGIEVELSRKKVSLYKSAGIFYSHQREVDRVLWLVEGATYLASLESHLATYDLDRSSIHNFVSLGQFQRQGWQSRIARGPEQGLTIHEFLHDGDPRKMPEKSQKPFSGLHFLDTRKSFVKAKV